MNKQEQLNSDKKILASLEAEYKRAQRVINSIRALVTDLNFEELMPDSQERCLMVDELQAYDYIRTNLMNRIRFYRARVKREESIKDWSQYKKADSPYIGVDVSNEGSHSGCCQVCGNEEVHHHCGQDAVNSEQLSDNLTDTYKDYCRGVFEQFLSREITWAKFVEKVALPFCHENVNEFVNAIKEGRSDCGQDATCQVGGGYATVQDPNQSQPAQEMLTKEDVEKKLGIHIHEGNAPKGQCGCLEMKSLLDMQVVGVGNGKCEGCPQDHYGTPCVKVELVGGAYICLAPMPNSIITE